MTPDTAEHALHFLVHYGDITVIAPATAAAILVLALKRRRTLALLWGTTFALCVAAVGLAKNMLDPFSLTVFSHVFATDSFPSGHAAMGTFFFGALAGLAWRGGRSQAAGTVMRTLFRVMALIFVLLGTSIVAAVYLLAWHPVLDIVVGSALGLGGALAVTGAAFRIVRIPPRLVVLTTAVALVTAVVCHDARAPMMAFLDRLVSSIVI